MNYSKGGFIVSQSEGSSFLNIRPESSLNMLSFDAKDDDVFFFLCFVLERAISIRRGAKKKSFLKETVQLWKNYLLGTSVKGG